MPAPAVIPAPIAYIKVVAVKKLVVGPWGGASPVCRDGVYWFGRSSFRRKAGVCSSVGGRFTAPDRLL